MIGIVPPVVGDRLKANRIGAAERSARVCALEWWNIKETSPGLWGYHYLQSQYRR